MGVLLGFELGLEFAAAGFYEWKSLFAERAFVSFPTLDVEFGGAVDGVGEGTVAAVGEAGHTDDLRIEGLEHFDGFQGGFARGDHIFGDEQFLTGFHLETAAQAHLVVHTLSEDGGNAQLAAQFVRHDDAAHGGSDHHVNRQVFHLFGDHGNHALGTVRVL